jgi:hypothetical protein
MTAPPVSNQRDLRACFVGDSFVAGVGDPDHRGWVGRIIARTHHGGLPIWPTWHSWLNPPVATE